MPLTLNELRAKGLAALRRELGQAGMIRFLQQFETGSGDYAAARQSWVDAASLDQIRALANRKKGQRLPKS